MYGKKEYVLIGRLVVKQYPELAKDIVNLYIKHEPLETDYSKIEKYFDRFCCFYQSPLTKQEHVKMRRVFLACMLSLYNPIVFSQPLKNIIIPRSLFVKNIAQVFEMTEANVSQMIRIVVADYQTACKIQGGQANQTEKSVYELFKEEVEASIKVLTNIVGD